MTYVWDAKKRELNLSKHGLDFVAAYRVYENPDKRTFSVARKGEDRKLDIALVEVMGLVLALVYILRDGDVRVISLRKASRKERRKYGRQD